MRSSSRSSTSSSQRISNWEGEGRQRQEGEGQEEEDKGEVHRGGGAEQDKSHLGAELERDPDGGRRVLQEARGLSNRGLMKMFDELNSLKEYVAQVKEKQKDINRIKS